MSWFSGDFTDKSFSFNVNGYREGLSKRTDHIRETEVI